MSATLPTCKNGHLCFCDNTGFRNSVWIHLFSTFPIDNAAHLTYYDLVEVLRMSPITSHLKCRQDLCELGHGGNETDVVLQDSNHTREYGLALPTKTPRSSLLIDAGANEAAAAPPQELISAIFMQSPDPAAEVSSPRAITIKHTETSAFRVRDSAVNRKPDLSKSHLPVQRASNRMEYAPFSTSDDGEGIRIRSSLDPNPSVVPCWRSSVGDLDGACIPASVQSPVDADLVSGPLKRISPVGQQCASEAPSTGARAYMNLRSWTCVGRSEPEKNVDCSMRGITDVTTSAHICTNYPTKTNICIDSQRFGVFIFIL
jgi:hypothetical protein